MKTQAIIKSFLAAVAFSLSYTGAAVAANTTIPFSSAPSTAQSATSSKPDRVMLLQEILNKVSALANIKFVVSTDISKDKVMHPRFGADWNTTVKNLLTGYNWVAIQDGDTIKTVIITGKSHDGNTELREAGEPTIDDALDVADDRQAVAVGDFNSWVSYMRN